MDYNVEFKSPGQVASLYDASPWRSSDHDPLIVGADLVQPYAFGGFGRPLEAPPVINVDRAGSAIPVKFSLGGFFGLGVIRPGYPRSAPVVCEPWGEPLGAFESAETAGGSMLSYDDGQYVFVWDSRREWAGQCREFQLRLDDGTLQRARFRFR